MSPSLYLRLMRRESRGARGRLLFFAACLAVGVAAVVAVAGLAAGLDRGIRAQARPLLAADLAVSGRKPPPAELEAALAALPVAGRAEVRELVTMAAAPGSGDRPGASLLVELKAVGPGYPFYGAVAIDPLLAPGEPLAARLDDRSVLAGPELLGRLGLAVGDTLRLGGEDFRIAGIVRSEPDRIQVGLTAGPRVLASLAALERTALVQTGSRVGYRTLVALAAPPGGAAAADSALAEAADRLRAALPPNWRVETWRDAQPELRRGIARTDRFLGLVALLSLLIGGIGVAQTVRSWLAGRLDAIAVLKCLGVRPREAFALYLGQTALLGLAGSLAGAAAGVAVQAAVPALFPDLVPPGLVELWQPTALLRGLALGVGVAVLFGVPALATVLRVPPVRVLRRDAEPPPAHRGAVAATAAALVAGVFTLAAVQARSPLLGAQFTGGLALAAALLTGAALAVLRLVGRLRSTASPPLPPTPSPPSRWGRGATTRTLPQRSGRTAPSGLWLRHGLAALARPGAATVGAIVALGLGVLVVVAMALVERQLGQELTADVPADAPSVFLVDIQPDQWPGVQELLAGGGARSIDSVPVVMARLTAIDGRGAADLAGGREGDARWALTREQRLTYLDELPADNEVVEGALWADPAAQEVSVEADFARDLGVAVGSKLTFDIQGVPLELAVTSLREVDWGTFGINFFLVVEPGVLEAAPQQRLAAVRLPPEREQEVQDRLAAAYPNVTLLRIHEILEKIVAMLDRIGLAVRFLGGFTVLAGVAILAGAVSAAAARRGREVALLKTLGATRAAVAARFAVEYALTGLVAGTLGTAAGAILAAAVLIRGFELAAPFRPLLLLAALGATVALAVAAGLAASTRALQQRPIEVLRGE